MVNLINHSMDVLSMFDGISCLQIALERAEIKVDKYYASEINRNSIKVTQRHYPKTIQLGNVNDVDFNVLRGVRLLAGGSPCQDISALNKRQQGLKGRKSSLFYKFLEAKEALGPNIEWLLENVSGNATEEISRALGRKPIKLDSRLVSAQTRKRLYWTNIPVNSLPKNKNILLTD